MIKVLDHGYVKLLNIAGCTRRPDREFDADDVDPAQVARISFDQKDSNRTAEQDHKLSRYLMKNKHSSPFEMIEIWLEMKLPIFIARQFCRHRTISLNECSGRYITLQGEWYIPDKVGAQSDSKKQGREGLVDDYTQEMFKAILDKRCSQCYDDYLNWLSQGVCAEQARLFLHLNHYTRWVWKQNLHNMMHFLSLRDHSHAQFEAQEYARAIDALIRAVLPVSMALYDEFKRME